MANDTEISLRPATESDRTYFARLLYLAEVFGDDAADVPDYVAAEQRKYVGEWDPDRDRGIVAVSELGTPAGGVFFRYFTLADRDNPVVGTGWTGNPEVPELIIAVERRFAGLGLGTTLLNAAVELAKSQGSPGISLFVDAKNPRARARYEKFGFTYRSEETMALWFHNSAAEKR